MKTKKLVSVTCPKLKTDIWFEVTEGKTYLVKNNKKGKFNIISDEGRHLTCLEKECAHLEGEDWILNYE